MRAACPGASEAPRNSKEELATASTPPPPRCSAALVKTVKQKQKKNPKFCLRDAEREECPHVFLSLLRKWSANIAVRGTKALPLNLPSGRKLKAITNKKREGMSYLVDWISTLGIAWVHAAVLFPPPGKHTRIECAEKEEKKHFTHRAPTLVAG